MFFDKPSEASQRDSSRSFLRASPAGTLNHDRDGRKGDDSGAKEVPVCFYCKQRGHLLADCSI